MSKKKYERNIRKDIENGYFKTLIIMADTYQGAHYYYNDYDEVIEGSTNNETLEGIIEDMKWKYEHGQ